MSNIKSDRMFAIPAFVILLLAWFIGSQLAESTVSEQLKKYLPPEVGLSLFQEDIYKLIPDSSNYLINAWGDGYGGALRSSLIFSKDGELSSILITSDKETPSYIRRLENKRFLQGIERLNWESLVYEVGVPDVVTGATYTSKAILKGANSAARMYAEEILQLKNLPDIENPRIQWTTQHTILIIVLLMSFLATRTKLFRRLKTRWVLLIFNLIFLGFWTSNQLSIVHFSRLSAGEIPPLGQHLFFYILLSGSLVFILGFNKNLYFDRICPFGAGQECLSALSGTKRTLRDKKNKIRWIPRILALAILCLGLIFRHPSSINYEVFSAFFQLLGNSFQFALLLLVLIASLLFKRPWCHLLCPVKPVLEYIQMVRNWIIQGIKPSR